MSVIPHIIYFYWDRGKLLPDWAKKNIASWHHFFPDYLIREIDETNFDMHQNAFLECALKDHKFTYLSDYIRLKTIYEKGGVYFDLDVEVVKDFRDLIDKGPYFGLQQNNGRVSGVNTGVGFADYAGDPLLKDLMKPYEQWSKDSFLDARGFPTISNCVELNTPVFVNVGVRFVDEVQCVGGRFFYPPDYFDPFDFFSRTLHRTANTRSIHAYSGTSNSPIDAWVTLYNAKLVKRRGGPISYRSLKLHMIFFHPFKAIQYHRVHKKR
jgi:hypothetical protein